MRDKGERHFSNMSNKMSRKLQGRALKKHFCSIHTHTHTHSRAHSLYRFELDPQGKDIIK